MKGCLIHDYVGSIAVANVHIQKKLLQKYFTFRELTNIINSIHFTMRKIIIDKMKKLQTQIEKWARVHGHENLNNSEEHRDDKGRLIWKRSDWEYVDDTYGHMVNDDEYEPHSNTLRKMNQLWKRYNVD